MTGGEKIGLIGGEFWLSFDCFEAPPSEDGAGWGVFAAEDEFLDFDVGPRFEDLEEVGVEEEELAL